MMTRSEGQSCDLGPLQKRILLHLATRGSKSINATVKEMSARRSSVRTAFYSLEKKEMITRVGKVSYRARDYDVFWLTENGILKALLDGADSNLVLKAIKRKFPKYDDTLLFAQIASRLPKRVLRVVSSLYPSLSFQVGVQEVLKLVFMADLSVDDLRRLYDVLKESRFKEMADEAIKKATEKFAGLKKIINPEHE